MIYIASHNMRLIGCWSFTSWLYLRSYQDGYILMTQGDFIVWSNSDIRSWCCWSHWDHRHHDLISHSVTLSWHRAYQSLPYPNNAKHLARKRLVSILSVTVLTRLGTGNCVIYNMAIMWYITPDSRYGVWDIIECVTSPYNMCDICQFIACMTYCTIGALYIMCCILYYLAAMIYYNKQDVWHITLYILCSILYYMACMIYYNKQDVWHITLYNMCDTLSYVACLR